MKSKNIIVLILTFFSLFLQAQTYFKPGYVIKSEGDTLFGEVDYRGDNRMTRVCTFRHHAKDSVRHFSPDEILGYRFPESKYYVSKVVNGKKVFLEFLINGRVSVYYSRDEMGNDHYYMEKDSLGFNEIPYEEGIKAKEGQEYFYTSSRHFGTLAYYMQDAEGLQPEILKLKKPNHNNLITLAKDYHNAVCTDDKCIIYEKKLPPFKVGLEMTGGKLFLNDHISVNYKSPQVGILAHVWLPMVNENLFFKTGILFMNTEDEDKKSVGIEVPFQVEYVYPHGIVRPKFAIGSNLPFLTLDLTPGVNIRLISCLFWTVNFNVGLLPSRADFDNEHLKILIFPRSLSMGLYLDL